MAINFNQSPFDQLNANQFAIVKPQMQPFSGPLPGGMQPIPYGVQNYNYNPADEEYFTKIANVWKGFETGQTNDAYMQNAQDFFINPEKYNYTRDQLLQLIQNPRYLQQIKDNLGLNSRGPDSSMDWFLKNPQYWVENIDNPNMVYKNNGQFGVFGGAYIPGGIKQFFKDKDK